MHLQNANLAHSCLRESATEYLFRDMTLTHVLLGASCNLEIFAVTKENAHLLSIYEQTLTSTGPACYRMGNWNRWHSRHVSYR